jgi:hypothetical protein
MNWRQVVYARAVPISGRNLFGPQWRYGLDSRTTSSIRGIYVERWLSKG